MHCSYCVCVCVTLTITMKLGLSNNDLYFTRWGHGGREVTFVYYVNVVEFST